ncbi:hypothetical protein AQS8620_03379 [Aquimixticola soesokkakensis]|uniref:Uncharacterized protein n=2 Tax=Aquimixticola soesokkakensis TaxID=1519096 RepID=A0A1Y5TW71_9RHOB|nr:hypothetical protein AQS8620_03379 [Aquimixticola soesokkakensis]
MFAAFADGRLRRLETENDAGHSTLFAKMSAYESYLAARDPAEAGKEGYWLRKFGSDHFEIWDVGSQSLTAWKDAFAKADGEVADRACFLTLPFAFERARFVVPDAPPPWMSDVIDEHYLPPMVAAMGGGALCMDDKAALRWRGKVLGAAELPQLGDQDWVKASRRGRRNKTELIRKAYQRQFPDGHKGPWKSVMRDLQREPGLEFSEKTLRRAVGTSLNEGGKTPD